MIPGWKDPSTQTPEFVTQNSPENEKESVNSPEPQTKVVEEELEEGEETEDGEDADVIDLTEGKVPDAEPMEVDDSQEPVVVTEDESDKSELEEGEIASSDDEEGEVESPTKRPPPQSQRTTHKNQFNPRSKQSSEKRELSLQDLGLPTSFAMK